MMHTWMVDGPGYFKHWYSIVFTRCFGQFGPYAFMCPLIDMCNHRYENECQTFFISKEYHLAANNATKSDKVAKGYWSHEKYLCDVRMITGKEKDEKIDKIMKG